uniref:Uncharacterized protein n=1 Tax=Catagonus wagneri TaxID=51154 RepID=A0A8C3VV17_9CETA
HGPQGPCSPRGGFHPPSARLQLTCCCHKFCFLGLSSRSWVSQELALFKGCGENWGESAVLLSCSHFGREGTPPLGSCLPSHLFSWGLLKGTVFMESFCVEPKGLPPAGILFFLAAHEACRRSQAGD